MSRKTKFPLHLFQVLEEEYVNMPGSNGRLENLTVELTDPKHPDERRPVLATLNWFFHTTHIKNASQFAAELIHFAEPDNEQSKSKSATVHTVDWVKENLCKYIVGNIDKENLERLSKLGRVEGTLEEESLETLTSDLNRLLEDTGLFREDRFSKNWLGTASASLMAEYSSPEDLSGDDLIHCNRLLLEDAFPKFLERINTIRLAAMFQRLHNIQTTALCLSGGGIRSGTFSLGILQGLARHNLLDEFNYLSTVSGGGYIGSWLTAWIHRHPQGLAGVTAELANVSPRSKIDPDPSPIRYLRKYSNFITPKVGLLTADTWTFIGIYLRNLFLNWLVFIPLLLAVLMLPRLLVTITLAQPEAARQVSWTLAIFGYSIHFYGRHILLLLGAALGIWSLAFIIFSRPGVRAELERRNSFWRDRSTQRGFLIYCMLPLLGSAICFTTYWAWSGETTKLMSLLVLAVFGAIFTFLSWFIASLILGRLVNARNREYARSWTGFIRLIGAGFVGGALMWLMSSFHGLLDSPVLKYGIGNGANFSWTVWSHWHNWKTELYSCFAVPVFLLVFLLAVTFFVGVSSFSTTVEDEDREWWARFSAWVLIAIISWSAATTLVFFGPIVLLSAPKTLASLGGISGILAVLLGNSARTPATQSSTTLTQASKPSLVSSIISRALPLLAVVFLASFLAALSLLTSGVFQSVARFTNYHLPPSLNEWLTNIPTPGFQHFLQTIYGGVSAADTATAAKIIHLNVIHHSSTVFVLVLGGGLFLFGMLLARAINLNIFSLHAGYRNRLIRAFLGASRPNHERKPNPFTGFDPADNINMHELRPILFDEGDLLDPVGLTLALRNPNNEVSRHLMKQDLLNNINSLPGVTTPSPRLVATLRKDLNAVLMDADLCNQPFGKAMLSSSGFDASRSRIRQLQEQASGRMNDLAPTDANILLNRLLLETAYGGMLRHRSLDSTPFKLMSVINTTLNLVGGENLAWQQRKAEPFTITPLHCGCYRVGYRPSRDYGGNTTGGISLGTAATISGAAASSNMGYYTTSPVLSLLLTLFNVRLGWWLGNPGPTGETTYKLRAPKFSVAPVIDEALGLTDDTNKYVYLTDGGHFENLAIYEMVLRRCHIIVACDGAQDPDYKFADLGNAVRKIRIDLGIPIEFFSMPIRASWPTSNQKGMYWAIAKIRYSCIDGPKAADGFLLYIKPAVYGTEPSDVLEYKRSFPAFPHQTTADQFFDEPQFESYRVLGSHIVDKLCDGNIGGRIADLAKNAVEATLAEDDNAALRKWSENFSKIVIRHALELQIPGSQDNPT